MVVHIARNEILYCYFSFLVDRLNLTFIYYFDQALQLIIVLVDQLSDVGGAQLVSTQIVMIVEFFIMHFWRLLSVLFDETNQMRVFFQHRFLHLQSRF